MTDAGQAVSSPSVMPLLPAWVEQQRWFVGRGPGRPACAASAACATRTRPAGPVSRRTCCSTSRPPSRPSTRSRSATARTGCPGATTRSWRPSRTTPSARSTSTTGRATRPSRRCCCRACWPRRPWPPPVTTAASHAQGHRQPGSPDLTVRASRVLRGEQSNTSVIYDTTSSDGGAQPLICKIFRVLHHGENPDVVVQSALALGGSHLVPRPFGHVSGQWPDERLPGGLAIGHLAFAQEFLPGVEDAWRVAGEALARGEDFSDRARALGRATAEVHATLAEVLPTVEATDGDRAALLASMQARHANANNEVPALAAYDKAAREVFAAAAARGLASPATHPRRLPPGPGARRPRPRLGAARLRGRADAPAVRAQRPRPPAARRGRHAALVRLRGRLLGAGAPGRLRSAAGPRPHAPPSSTATPRAPGTTRAPSAPSSPRSSSTRPSTRWSTRPATVPAG